MCARCEELEERVAWLESELGIVAENEQYRRLRDAMRAPGGTKTKVGRQAAVGLIMALFRARGRTLTRFQLLDAIPSPGGVDRTEKLVNVWVCFARRSLGMDAIESVWGRGYRLSEAGMDLVAQIVEPQREAA